MGIYSQFEDEENMDLYADLFAECFTSQTIIKYRMRACLFSSNGLDNAL